MDNTPVTAETDLRLRPPAETAGGQAEPGPLSAEGWASGLRRIEKLVRHAPFDQRALRVRLRPRGSHHEARVVLVLPADTLVGLGEGETADLAFSEAIGWLAGELRRRTEIARAEVLELRRRLRQRDIAGATGFLVLDHARGDDASFIDVFRPLLRHARDHAYRELAAAECVGAAELSAVTVSDVLDQALVRAWNRFGDRPRDRAIDEWLITLVEEVLDEYTGDAAVLSETEGDEAQRIARLAARHERLADSEPHWGAPALLSLEVVLPDAEPSELLAGLGPDAEDRMLMNLLADVPPAQRRAFTLSALEGYSADEIARIQSRSPGAVHTDIRLVRDRLCGRVTDYG
ncbi:MAG TPA: sigma factor-like helix-turn-helix DNA-binding protein [Gemmatimonadaceae bacterium]|jgi:DNA-directed RNA polymerase specialized sigma24 family protein|nr:sigma factor-like helix-turn-helix DNA-binding protein [Gemmatimonadaceae bacterium]